MPKASVVVEEENEEDKKMRVEFEEFGETITGKITDKNRPLLVKKLNHLRARRRMSEKLSQSLVKVSPKRPAASRRGRGRKGRPATNQPSHKAVLDDECDTGEGDQMNNTFSIADTTADGEPAVKQSRYVPASSAPFARDGPYAVIAMKTAAGESTMQLSDTPHDPSQHGSTGTMQNGVFTSKSLSPAARQNTHVAAKTDVPRRGRTRTVDDFGVSASTVKVATDSESNDDSSVPKASLPMKRNARASAVPAAVKLPVSTSTQDQSVAEGPLSTISSADVKIAAASAEERGRTTGRGQKYKPDLEGAGKERSASRIPKLARLPTPLTPPPQQKSATSSAVPVPSQTVVNTAPNLITRVVDTVSGTAAAGMVVKLFSENQSGTWSRVADSATDEKGMAAELGTGKYWAVGVYRLHFETGSYFDKRAVKTLYPHIDVVFNVADPAKPVQIELAVGPYGYSTYAHTDSSQ